MHTTRTHHRRLNRRGITILGDLTWVLVFCVCATILFFFLFKPLVEKINTKTDTRIAGLNIQPVYSDAEYVALGLRETKPVAGSSGTTASDFIDTVRELAEARATTSDDKAFKQQVSESAYVKTLDTVFAKDNPFWTGSTYVLANGNTKVSERETVAVVIRSGAAWLPDTCREYTADGPSDTGLCTNSAIKWKDSTTVTDPDTKLLIPDFRRHVEPGSLHIPTAQGSATLYVFIERGERG